MSIPFCSTFGILMNQEMVEYRSVNRNNENEMTVRLERDIAAITSTSSPDSLKVYLFDISTQHQSASQSKYYCSLTSIAAFSHISSQPISIYVVPERTHSTPLSISQCDMNYSHEIERRQKRARLSPSENLSLRSVMSEVQFLSNVLDLTLSNEYK